MHLHEVVPPGGRSSRRGQRRRFERIAEVCEDLTSRGRSHPGLRPLANLRFEVSRLLPAVCSEPDVATAPRAREREVLGDPRHELGPRDAGCVVGSGLGVVPVTLPPALSRRKTGTGCGVGPCGEIADRQRRHGPSERVIRGEDAVVSVAMPSWRGHEVGQAVEKLAR
jgi:hypothetical protein